MNIRQTLIYTCFSAWYDERTNGALSTCLKPFPKAIVRYFSHDQARI